MNIAGLCQGARMTEIGKRDIWSPQRIAQERPDITYSLLAIDFFPPEALQASLSAVSTHLATLQQHPLPVITHPLAAAPTALRQMSQARHIGKMVVQSSATMSGQSALQQSTSMKLQGVAVTGGLGALGSLTGRHMARGISETIMLLGRSGRMQLLSTPSTSTLVPWIRGDCVALVTMAACDVATEEGISKVLGTSPSHLTHPSIEKGVHRSHAPRLLEALFHAGGVLADATLANQTLAGLRSVAAAKLPLAASSHRKLPQQPMASQVYFSSVTALLASPGQANYAATNAALDALAAQQTAMGMSGVVSMEWGAWAGSGMAVQQSSTEAGLKKLGLKLLNPLQGLAALSGVLSSSGKPQGWLYQTDEVLVGQMEDLCSIVVLLCLQWQGASFST